MRFLLLDRITAWDPPRSARAVKCVSLSEDALADHFPRDPILPGTLILEGMAQLAGLLLEEAAAVQAGRIKALMTVVEKAKFRRRVRPGERLDYHAEVLSVNESGGKAMVTATCAGEPCADARLVFAFAAYRNDRLDALQRTALEIWKRGLPA